MNKVLVDFCLSYCLERDTMSGCKSLYSESSIAPGELHASQHFTERLTLNEQLFSQPKEVTSAAPQPAFGWYSILHILIGVDQ